MQILLYPQLSVYYTTHHSGIEVRATAPQVIVPQATVLQSIATSTVKNAKMQGTQLQYEFTIQYMLHARL